MENIIVKINVYFNSKKYTKNSIFKDVTRDPLTFAQS